MSFDPERQLVWSEHKVLTLFAEQVEANGPDVDAPHVKLLVFIARTASHAGCLISTNRRTRGDSEEAAAIC